MDTQQVTGRKDQFLRNVDIQKTGKNQLDRNDIEQICLRKTESNTPTARHYQSRKLTYFGHIDRHRNLTHEILTEWTGSEEGVDLEERGMITSKNGHEDLGTSAT